MRMAHKGDIKALEIIHGNFRGRVKVGGLMRRHSQFVIFLIDVKIIPIRRDAFSKIGCVS